MKNLNRINAKFKTELPLKILQFGGGNFMRGFVDWMIDVYNQKTDSEFGILVVKLTQRGDYHAWQNQEGLYHVITRGIKADNLIDEVHLVRSVCQIIHIHPDWDLFLQSAEHPDIRFVTSNTTEAGIKFSDQDQLTDRPPKEFPAILTLWLYHRYRFFDAAQDKGCIFLPVELILNNGEQLRASILRNAANWGLEEAFKAWIKAHNVFCNTLVDRIVPGLSKASLPDEMKKVGYEDHMMTLGEAFHFWAIEGPEQVRKELPLDQAGLNVIYTDDLSPYRKQKVRILNGAHSSMVPVGFLYGLETVKETVEDEVMGQFVKQCIFEEIIPTLEFPKEVLDRFAEEVLDRFRNPFVRHQLISIALNAVSKFKTRVLPSILEYQQRSGTLPKCLVYAFAALIHFYKGTYKGQEIPLKDDDVVIDFLQKEWEQYDGTTSGMSRLTENVLKWKYVWKTDLSEVPGLKKLLSGYLHSIEKEGIQESGLMKILDFYKD